MVGISEPSTVALGLSQEFVIPTVLLSSWVFLNWPSSCRLSREIAGLIKGRFTIWFPLIRPKFRALFLGGLGGIGYFKFP